MRFPPPEVVASWPPPNYEDPQTRGPALLIVELILLPVALLCLALRLYVRLRIIGKSEWDDWLMVAAATFATGVTTCVILAFVRYGWDIHIWDLTVDKMISGRQVSFAAQGLFVLATGIAKSSILLSYLRLAPLGTWFRRMTVVTLWFVALTGVSFFIVLFTQCIPVSSYWNLANNQRDCVREGPSLMAHAVSTLLADFMVWLLPLPSLYHTKLRLAQRVALIVLFSFGAVVVFAACMRIYWLHYVLDETYDVTWEGFHLWMWTAVEVQLGIICGCVPWLKSLFTFWKSMRSVTDLTGSSAPAHRSRSEPRQSTAKGAAHHTLVGLHSVGSATKHASRTTDAYLDLESGSASSTHLSEGSPGLAL